MKMIVLTVISLTVLIEALSFPLNDGTIKPPQSSRIILNIENMQNGSPLQLKIGNGPFREITSSYSSSYSQSFSHRYSYAFLRQDSREKGYFTPHQSTNQQQFKNIEVQQNRQMTSRKRSENPIEWAGLFEGDIAGVDPSSFFTADGALSAVRNPNLLWSGGIIPYTTSTSFNSDEIRKIEEAIKNYRDVTCIRFVPRTNEKDYVVISKGIGCSSAVGRQGGAQQLSLAAGCFIDRGTVTHELMHAVGFWHEQSRPDRDNYVTIRYENIPRDKQSQFMKYEISEVQTLNTTYDIQSVMHYTAKAFAIDDRYPTIVSKTNIPVPTETVGFSNTDILKINRLYRCQSANTLRSVPEGIDAVGICEDRHGLCSRWAAEDQCSVNPRYMLPQCPKSCNQCSHPVYPSLPADHHFSNYDGYYVINSR